jgi:septum formation protein
MNSIYLASASPRRQELLRQIGVEFELCPVDVDEAPRAGESPAEYVRRVARDKALAAAGRLRAGGSPPRPVLAADTSVVLGDRILGKPADERDARGMLEALSGRTHCVLTAVCVDHAGASLEALSESRVRFAELNPGDIARYWATGEPADKAGAYGVQGRGAAFVSNISGSYSGIVGLPLFEVAAILRRIGFRIP